MAFATAESMEDPMIRLLRTHPRHLAGGKTTFSSSSRLRLHGPHEAPRFGRILREVLDTKTDSLRSKKAVTPDTSNPLGYDSPPKGVPQCHGLPVTRNNETERVGNTHLTFSSSRDSVPFEPFIEEASQKFGVGKELIRSVIKAESNFNPKAESRSGAIGLMQLLPATGRELGVTDLYNPRDNILGGTRYLAMLLDRYEGNLQSALAAYNWGLGNLEKSPTRLPKETEQYIQRILGYLDTLTA